MTTINQDEINSILWRACDTFRGTIDPSEYKNYILVMLFVKYISDVWHDHRAALIERYGGDVVRAERQLQYERFVLPPGSDFYSLYEKRNAPNLGEEINKALEAIEAANKAKLNGVFRNIDFNSEANLGQTAQRNERLRNLLADFNDEKLDLRPSVVGNLDVIGNAYEYLIGRFASGAGKKAGEFYTPPEVSALLATLLDPQPGERICDPACGSGSLLIQCAKRVGSEDYSLWGQEANGQTWALCMMNMFLHNVNQPTIHWGDTLKDPLLLEDGRLMRFNVVVANPPFALDKWGAEGADSDPYNRYHRGIPPKSNADYAFISHMVETMLNGEEANGRVGVIVPHGVLFRGGAEGEIREALIRENLLDAVIGLPPNLFFGTALPAAILIFKRNRSDNRVLFIDASRLFESRQNYNHLAFGDIERIVRAFRARETIDNFAYLADLREIETNQFNLNIARYVFAYEIPEARGGATDCDGAHDIFVSYSRDDHSEMMKTLDKLIGAGFRVWTDTNLEPGTADWQRAIEVAIENACAVIVLMSPASKRSEWVKREITYAATHEKRIFPVLIVGDERSAVPIALIGAQFADLRSEQNDVNSLLDALKIHLNYREYRSPFVYDFDELCKAHGWKQVPLEGLVSVTSGKHQVQRDKPGAYPLYHHSERVGYSEDFEFDGRFIIVDLSQSNSQTVLRVSGKFAATRKTIVLQVREDIDCDFLYFALKVIDFRQYGEIALSKRRVPKQLLASIHIPFPRYEKQVEIAEFLTEQIDTVEMWANRFKKQLIILEQRPISLIQTAFKSG